MQPIDMFEETSIYRSLGAQQKMFWLGDLAHPLHFAMTAQIKGKFSVDELKQALAQVQQRHPLLRVRIALDEAQQPWFVEADARIGLRVVQRQSEKDWQREVERELSEPFFPSQAPLVRAVLLHSIDVSELIVICYHAVADGMSAVCLIRDILQAIATPDKVQSLPVPPSLEELAPGRIEQNRVLSRLTPNIDSTKQAELTGRSKPNYRTYLHSGSLSKETTTLLVSRCRQEQTTVHAAICAAFMLAIASQNSSEQPQNLKCFSAINIRRYLMGNVGEYIGLYVSAALSLHPLTTSTPLWDVARSLKHQLNQKMTPDQMFGDIPQLQEWMSSNPSPSEVFQGMVEEYCCDLLVSNLGRLNLSQFGELKLQAIYGPATLTGMENKGMLAVTTVEDQLFFTLVCPQPDNLHEEAIQLLERQLIP